jgi:hypothetical protein
MYARAMFHFLGSDGSLLIGIQPFSWLSQENCAQPHVFVSHLQTDACFSKVNERS